MNQQEKRARLAVLIDADNVQARRISNILDEISKYGVASVKRIYADWTQTHANSWKELLLDHSLQPIQQFAYTCGKNSTDSAMIIDAMDLLYTRNFDGFCLITSDSDFTRLAARIREEGLLVYGFGEKKTPKSLIRSCDRFTYVEILEDEEEAMSEEIQEEKIAHPKAEKEQSNSSARSKKEEEREIQQLFNKAFATFENNDDWINLGEFGKRLSQVQPDFDARNYGFTQLNKFISNYPNLIKIKHEESRGYFVHPKVVNIEKLISNIHEIIREQKGGWVSLSLIGSNLSRRIENYNIQNFGYAQLNIAIKSHPKEFLVKPDGKSYLIASNKK